MLLTGKPTGTIITEFRGPQVGFNYMGSAAAHLIVAFPWGDAQLRVYSNTTAAYMGSDRNSGSKFRQLMPNPNNWSALAAAFGAQAAPRMIALTTPDGSPIWYRLVVESAGTGTVQYGCKWAKQAA